MNRSFIAAVLTLTMILIMSTVSFAAAPMHNFSCDNCHGRFIGSGMGFVPAAKSCISCHNPMGEASGMPVDSMANFFGSVPGQSPTGTRSNHTYMVSYSGAPSGVINYKSSRSNTREATTPALTALTDHQSKNQTKQVTCNRCHNAAGPTNANFKPMLRATNNGDALCLDCHINRNVSNVANGNHPVNINYSSISKRYTTAYRRIPVSANINNTTAQLGNYLSVKDKGKIVCSTCHAVHYGDSSSATFDNASTANGFAQDDIVKGLKGQLQNSKGQLLRTDPIGVSPNSINVCSSCHKETANLNHNAKGQNVQCGHCHGAHVDYTGDNSLKNIDLVRRDFSNISTDMKKPGNVKVLFNNSTGFKRADGKGICQICHVLPSSVSAHNIAGATNADCRGCHNHKNGFSPVDCTTCHGQPPITSLVGGPNGKASASYTLDESLSPHATHADSAYYNYACKNCHYEGTRQDSHNTATPSFQSVFVDPTNTSVGVLAGKAINVPGDYNKSSKVCSNVYCHSNGSPRGGSYTTFVTPSWEYGRNKILGTATECNSCHQSGASLNTNAHNKHVAASGLSCNVCHAATVGSTTAISDRSKHADGTKDIVFPTKPTNFKGVFSSSWTTSNASCTNSCHSDGLGGAPVETPVWTNSATGDCGSCHAAVATTSLHPFHFTGPTGPLLGANPDCASCHDYAAGAITHANGDVDLKAGNSCAPCHPGSSPIWATGAKVTCESCHTGVTLSIVNTYAAPANVRPNNTLGHGKYSSASLHVKCTSCHNAAAPHIRPAVAAKRLLVAGNALCSTCHIPSIMGIHSTARANLPVHGGTVNAFTTYTSSLNRANISALRADACAGCHDTHGTTNLMSVRTSINGKSVTFNNTSSGLVAQSTVGGFYTGLCQVCHTKTKYFRNNRTPENGHMSSNGKNCLSCHTHKGTFAFTPGNGTCGSCHGYPPVRSMAGLGTSGNYINAKLQDYSGGGGAHTMKGHIARTVVESDDMTKCNDCHYNTFTDNTHFKGPATPAKSFVNVVVDPKYKFNNTSTIRYNAQTCSNVSCHFKKSPNWTNGL